MSETTITLRMQFSDESLAQGFLDALTAAADRHDHELSASLASLTPLSDYPPDQTIDIEQLSRDKLTVIVSGYSGRIDPPFWLIPGVAQLGANRTVLSEARDDGAMRFFFIGTKKVSKKVFEASAALMPQPPLQAGPDVFFPEGRVVVKARLLSYEWKESMFEVFCVMRMQAEDGRFFIYKGSAGLTTMTEDDYEKTCTFSATFELGKYGGEIVAFARRPTKIQLTRISAEQAEANAKKHKFTGSNRAFMEGPYGPMVSHYLNELGAKPDAFIQRMGSSSALGVELTDLFGLLNKSKGDSFNGLKHYITAGTGSRDVFEIYTVGDVATDVEAARQHLNTLDIEPTYKDDSPNVYTLYWLHDGIRIRFKVWAKGFECFMDRPSAQLAELQRKFERRV